MSDTCIFCTIYKKEMGVLFENDSCFVIADINPLSKGHLLVIPKRHCSFMHELPDEDLVAVLPLIKRITTALGYAKYNILQNNGHIQSVFHVHFHIVPFVDEKNSLKVSWNVLEMTEEYFTGFVEDVKEKLKEINY